MEVMKYAFLRNIKSSIKRYHKTGSQRIKLEWVHPSCIGLFDNDLFEKGQSVFPKANRELFIQLIKEIAFESEMNFDKVIKAFIGEDSSELL